jgi:RNA polymerase sigma factor (TIGR02999 family)
VNANGLGSAANLTLLLTQERSGQPHALEHLTPRMYDELRRLARSYMRSERSGHTLQATAVVHEAFMRLINAEVVLQDHAHLFALASRLMRRVLVDHAKTRSRQKRNRGAGDAVLESGEPAVRGDFHIIALDEALQALGEVEPRLAEIVDLHYFGGLTYEQIAATVGISTATIHRNIRLARAWLSSEIAGST